jgi:hypothetical protein
MRAWLLDKIHRNEAFWMLPDFQESLWMFKNQHDMVLFRQVGKPRAEFIGSSHPDLNNQALTQFANEVLNESFHFFCCETLNHPHLHALGPVSLGMTEAPLKKSRPTSTEDSQLLAIFKVQPQAERFLTHPNYPEPCIGHGYRWLNRNLPH